MNTDTLTTNVMDVLIPFLTSTETPFFFLYVTLFVYTIRGAAGREKVCNDALDKIRNDQREILRMLVEERKYKKGE